jgi:hypothetical protein
MMMGRRIALNEPAPTLSQHPAMFPAALIMCALPRVPLDNKSI